MVTVIGIIARQARALANVLPLVLIMGCGGTTDKGPEEPIAHALTLPPAYPPYNKVYRKAGHNSYWVPYHFGGLYDVGASGTRERILDQLLHEHVRSFELDLHRDDDHPGHFTIYHTSETDNSTCHDLEACLQLFKRFDYLVPDHEVVNIIFEAKETSTLTARTFEGDHHIEDFDRTLWEYLGSRIYTPREFLSRCAPGATLVQCARDRGWPTIDELRGRYISST
jgi:hypothetical protein